MDVKEVLEKYSRKLGDVGKGKYSKVPVSQGSISKDYEVFKRDMAPEFSRYERIVNTFGKFIKIKVGEKDRKKISKHLENAHLNIDPGGVVGLAVFSFLVVFFLGILSSVGWWLVTGTVSLIYIMLLMITGGFLFYYFYFMPARMAVIWRLKAGSQMVNAILYTVIYMKHTSNLERAIGFVAQNIEAPLSLDLRKVLWNVETGKFSNIKDSLDDYLDFWKETNIEFVESFHLIESSLYEPDNARRVQTLERSLRVILDGVYTKLLKYSHSIKSPLTNLYMLGIVLPTLGLALLPLVSTLLGGLFTWVHVFVLFNLIVPFLVFYMTMQIMLKRPGGYGETSLLKKNPSYHEYASKRPYLIAGLIAGPLLILGLLPLLVGYTFVGNIIGDFALKDVGLGFLGNGNFFGFEQTLNGLVGPFGIGSLLLSLFVPLSFTIFFSLSFRMRTKNLMKSRNQAKELEKEFNSSLFSLGNRLGDGLPAEIAFSKVAESTKGQKTEHFFRIVSTNITSMGMSLEEAIFNPRRGALVYYPSQMIASSMRILIESVKKGLKVAAESLLGISEYVNNINKINERLRDLLAEVSSDMRSNMTFLAPLLAGIVIGLASMITGILGQLKILTEVGQGDTSVAGLGSVGNLTQLFDIVNMIPPYFMQIAIGIYLIQIIFILTSTLVTVDSGQDKLRETHEIGKNLMRGIILYLIVALIAILSLGVLSGVALGGLAG